MGTTDNGYSAPPLEGIRACGFDGAFAVPGVKNWEPVYAIFSYLMEQFDTRVEYLRPGWCWGYAYRANANDPNSLSRHSGAIAVDLNAPLHPNGVPTDNVFTQDQQVTINRILDEIRCDCHGYRVLRWGGDYTSTPDAMHFEINLPQPCVISAAQKLKEGPNMAMDQEDREWFLTAIKEALQPVKEASVRQTKRIMYMEGLSAETDIRHAKLLKAIARELNVENPNRVTLHDAADDLERAGKERLRVVEILEAPPSGH